jgi:hypothetical protein
VVFIDKKGSIALRAGKRQKRKVLSWGHACVEQLCKKGKRQKGGICESLIRLFTILRFCADVNRPARTAIFILIKDD